MGRYKSFAGGSGILPSDLDAIEDDFEGAYSSLKVIRSGAMRLDAPSSSGPYLLVGGSAGSGVPASGATAGLAVAYLDPAWFDVSSVNERVTYYQLAASLLVNGTAPACTFTPALYPVTASSGASGVVAVTLGSPVSGSAINFATPLAGSRSQGVSGSFPAPQAGFYAIAVAVSPGAAAGSSVALAMSLQMRQA